MKFIIHRSRAGFGDRLTQLCMCIEIAIKSKRILVVDWRDNVWAGNDEDKNFYYYFTLNDVPHITYSRFLEVTKKIKINSVWPFKWEKWENCDLSGGYHEDYIGFMALISEQIKNGVKGVNKEVLSQHKHFNEELESLDISDFTNSLVKKEHDVLIWQDFKVNYPGKCLLFSKIRFKDNVIKFINDDINSYIIRNKIPYIAIHLRGTDRTNNFKEELCNGSDNTELYINSIVEKIDSNTCKNVMLLTDSIVLKNKFIELYDSKFNIILNSTILLKDDKSIHTSKENKEINNLHMLKDYNYLIKSIDIYSDGKSYFSNSAKIINNTLKIVKNKNDINDEDKNNINEGISKILCKLSMTPKKVEKSKV